MSLRAARPRYLVLTPGITSADGISALSRLVVRALGPVATQSASAHVDVLSMTDPPGLRAGDQNVSGVRFFGAGGRKSRFIATALRVAVGGRRPTDVLCLHLHLGPVARLIAGRRTRLTTALVGIEAWKPLWRLDRLALSRSDILMAISEHTAQRFREANPDFSDRPVRVCHLAVPDEDGPGVWRKSDGMTDHPGPPFALIVGRMATEERYKGHDLLIDIWPRVAAEVPGARLVVVGDGDDRLRLEAKAARVKGLVRFLGRISDGALAALYRDCAFLVMPSRDEGFGLVFLEAMRAGKACIGGLGAAAELIEDGMTGLVVDPADPESILKAVLRLFREPETRERMGRAGAMRVAREFTEAHFRHRFRALLGLGPEAG